MEPSENIPPTLTAVVAGGDRRASLEAVRDTLAATIAVAEPSNVAALAKQLRDTLAELDALPAAKEVSDSDDLARKRADRLAAQVPKPATKRGKRGAGSG